MQRLWNTVVTFLAKEDGPAAVEYAVMLALIVVVCITAITTLGTKAQRTFEAISAELGKTNGSGS